MEILFGKHLDGSRGVTARNGLGQVGLGPQGLLALLETHLGLLGVQPSQSERIVQYAAILAQGKAGAFYEQSFDVDELGTARTLLAWRDEWYLHGWSGAFSGGAAPRLTKLADLETLAVAQVGPCEGQRLQRVARALEDGLQVPVSRLVLLEELSRHPAAWRQVLSRFQTEVRSPFAVSQSEGSLLASIRTRLMAGKPEGEPLPWRNDGSVRVVRAESPLLAAHWLVAELSGPHPSRLLMADARASLLDEVLQAHGLPVLELDERSVFRPALQVLPLVLQQLWQPVNVHALLELLTHPVCPIPSFARHGLAAYVASRPGIDVEAWMASIANHAPKDDPSQRKRAEDAVRLYLAGSRHEPGAGAPVNHVLILGRELTVFFQRRLAMDEPQIVQSAMAGLRQCAAFVKAVEARETQGVSRLSPRQLQLLVEQATTAGSGHGLDQVQAGAVACATHPAGVGDIFDQVIWWHPVMPDLPGNYPWSQSELATLQEAGVRLPPLTEKMAWMAEEWLRPLQAARNNLTLVLPPQEDEIHPVWQMIQAVCPEIPVLSLEEPVFHGQAPGTRPVQAKPLPGIKTRWKLSPGSIPTTREVDSYSSLNVQITNPSQWVLSYVARLRESSQLTIPDDFTLKGTLAHRLIETLFLAHGITALGWSEEVLRAWFDPSFEALIDREGAVFRMPGKHNEGELFRFQLFRAIRSLLQILKNADVRAIQPECALEGAFEGGRLQGSADLVLTLPLAQPVIMDLKWSGKRYGERLQQNRQLQLAVYGELYRQMGHAFAKPAYFVLSSSRLFHVDDGLFPGEWVEKKEEELGGGPELWQSFLKTWRWRQAQLKNGDIHVVIEATADQMEPAPEDGYRLDEPGDRYNPYVSLCGWRQDQ